MSNSTNHYTVLDYKGKPVQIKKGLPVTFNGKKRINIGCMRWVIAFFVFLPLLLLILLVGDKVWEVESEGVKYHLNEDQYRNLYSQIYPQ